MGFRISTNVSSLAAQRSLNKLTNDETTTSSQLASGQRITKSADDAAGLAISEKLKANIRSSAQAKRNANDGISMLQVAEGGLSETGNILIRLKELGVQASTDTLGDTERGMANLEFQQLKEEMQRISQTTSFNDTNLLDGTGEGLEFQVGIGNDQFKDRIGIELSTLESGLTSLGVEDASISSKAQAQETLEVIGGAIEKVSGNRAVLGALQNRLNASVSNTENSIENMSAANSRIRDVDYAEATAKNTQLNILKQAGTSVLSQANQKPQQALRLIG